MLQKIMAETYPYPAQEHYEFPHTPLEVLDDELQTYGGGEQLRRGVIVLGRAYVECPLFQNLTRYSQLMKVAATSANLVRYHTSGAADPHFLGGAVLAAHCSVRPMPKLIRMQVLHDDILGVMPDSPGGIDTEPALHEEAIEELIEYRRQGWRRMLDVQSDVYREKIVEASERMYIDLTEAGLMGENFTAGYLFASHIIFSSLISKGYSPSDSVVYDPDQ